MEKRKRFETSRFITSSLDIWRIDNLLDDVQGETYQDGQDLLRKLRKGKMVGPKEIPPNVVTMNCILEVTISRPEKTQTEIKLVYPSAADEADNHVSVFSKLGRTLIGMTEGQSEQYQDQPGKTVTVKVEKIVYQPEKAGHFQI